MSIRQSVLALLVEQSRHGYELKGEFERRTGKSWPVNVGQIYTTLDRLERDGLVQRGSEDAEGRVHYEITASGRDEVTRWFDEPVAEATPPRDELAIKLALAVTLPGLDVAQIIQTQRVSAVHALQTYTRARAQAGDDVAWRLIANRLIFDTEAEIRWLDECEAELLNAASQVGVQTKRPAAQQAQKARR